MFPVEHLLVRAGFQAQESFTPATMSASPDEQCGTKQAVAFLKASNPRAASVPQVGQQLENLPPASPGTCRGLQGTQPLIRLKR